MSVLDRLLNWGPFFRVRRNHGLEHATLQVLAEKRPGLRMAGYSDTHGFWLIGEIETERVRDAVGLALARLCAGENSLAVHSHCGTNLVTTGFLAGTFAWLGMLGTGRNMRERWERLPFIITLVTLGVFLSQPLGPYLQARVTTSPAAQGMGVLRIERRQRGDMPVHRVYTQFQK
jgi:hypothetical protein